MDFITGLVYPSGTDKYDISVYNENLSKLENAIIDLINYKIEMFNYGSAEDLNIDTVDRGWYIYDGTGSLAGTFPEDSTKKQFILLCMNSSSTSAKMQLYANITNNRLYSRTKPKNASSWGSWSELDSNSSSGGINIQYPTTLNIDECETGIYIIDGNGSSDMISGTFPNEINKTGFQLISYGSPSNSSKVITQEIISTYNAPTNVRYIRTRYANPNAGSESEIYKWSDWEKVNTGSGGSSGSDITLKEVDI